MDETSPPASVMPYVASTLLLFLVGVILIGTILWLRPALDPLVIIASVMGFVVSISAAIAAFIKSQETHLSVNSQLTAWKKEFYRMAHAEGMLLGSTDEQLRVAEQKRLGIIATAAAAAAAAAATAAITGTPLVPVVPVPQLQPVVHRPNRPTIASSCAGSP